LNERPDWDKEGLLDGLGSDDERHARRELLDYLTDDGCSVEELREAIDEDRLALLPMERLILRERRYTVAEAADKTGLSEDYLSRNWRALGLTDPEPDEPTYTDQNVDGMKAVKAMFDAGASEQAMLELTRLVGDATAKIADAVMRVFGDVLLKAGDTERDVALRMRDVAEVTRPFAPALLTGPLEAHVVEMLRHEAIGRIERERGSVPGARDVAICFADMVDFTKLSERLDVDELSDVTQRFSDLTGEIAQAPVRLVKTIGDEAMLASEDAAALVETSLNLIDAAESDDVLPELRAGAAAGQALRRAGDWYGRPVNLAARITGAAPIGGLVANDALREAAGDGFDWAEAGSQSFKGIDGEVELYAVRSGDDVRR
jgi:adenylate cyclase